MPDIFEIAWDLVAKFANPATIGEEMRARRGEAPAAPASATPVCKGCSLPKMNIDPNTEMCSICSARGPVN